MVNLLGKKKHKAAFTARPSEQAEYMRQATSKVSLVQPPLDDSDLSLEPLDLRGNFFSEDEPASSQHTRSLDDHEERRPGGYFGAARKSYTAPIEQSEFRESVEAGPSKAVSTRHSQSSKQRDSQSLRRMQSTDSINNLESPDSPLTRKLTVPPHRTPFNRLGSYQHGYDLKDLSRTNNFAVTTPLASPLMITRAEDHFLASEDPFDAYYDSNTAVNPSVISSSLRNSFSPPPQPKSETRSLPEPKYDGLEYSSGMSSPAGIPRMDHKKSSRSVNAAYRNSILKDQLAEMTYTEKRSNASRSLRSYQDDEGLAAIPLHRKAPRANKKWYRGWSTRSIILLIVGVILLVALILGLSLGLHFEEKDKNEGSTGLTPTWRPGQGTTFNVQLLTPMSSTPTTKLYAYNVYDIDLFDNNATTIAMLHTMGRRVICYFSAGTYESWRPDASQFPNATLGGALPAWSGERWVDVRSTAVRSIMTARIDLAIAKGCDGVDPDNVDSYNADTSFPLTAATNADYVNYLAIYSHTRDLAIGLKNAPELINATLNNVDWEINESCATYNECDLFQPFIQAGKPVMHLEYTASGSANATLLGKSCNAEGTHGFSTLVKRSKLDGWAMSCPVGDTSGMYGIDATM